MSTPPGTQNNYADYCPVLGAGERYREEVFAVIKQLAPTINRESAKYDVPPVAVAGSIADEFNTRTGGKAILDWIQDAVLINWMPNSFIAFDAMVGVNSKMLNATKHDLGKGNIKLETAQQTYERNNSTFADQNMDWEKLVDYILTDEGTVHVAALVIKKAKAALSKYVKDAPPEVQEAVYVTYYKQGPSYVSRFEASVKKNAQHRLKPGEGCRVLQQRDKIVQALGLSR